MKQWMMVIVCMSAGCLLDDGERAPVCGDFRCHDGETASSCPEDCDPTCTPACEGETICVRQRCESAFDRDYTFTLTSGEFPLRDGAGELWDPSGLPDPRVVLCRNLDLACWVWFARVDTTSPVWNEGRSGIAVDAFGFIIFVEEEDVGPDQSAWTCDLGGDAIDTTAFVETLRSGEFVCTGTGAFAEGRMHFRIEPD